MHRYFRRWAAPTLAGLTTLVACARPMELRELTADQGCAARAASRADVQPVRWRLPVSGSDRGALAPWCAAVGAPVVSGAPADGGALDSLAIVTWNVHGGGGDVARLVADLRAGALTGGRPVRDFVLLLQEAHRSSPDLPDPSMGRAPSRVEAHPLAATRVDVVESARAAGLALYYVPSMRNGREAGPDAEDRGNAILSTRPLSSLEALELPFEAQRRVAIGAVVQGRASDGVEWRLRIVNAHLDTRSTGLRVWASGGAGRARQSRAVAASVAGDMPAVLGGDLNTWSFDFMEGAIGGLATAFPDTPGGIDGPTFRTGWGFTRRLDHLFFRLAPGWTARRERVDDRYGSDHHPLLAWVRPGPASFRIASDRPS